MRLIPQYSIMEGLIIDEHITFADLKGTLESFLRHMYGDDTKVRFRTSFFPFTEPSAEVDISCVMWWWKVAVYVLIQVGLKFWAAVWFIPMYCVLMDYDPERLKGFAFGMGVERIAMLLYGINRFTPIL